MRALHSLQADGGSRELGGELLENALLLIRSVV